MMLMEPYDPDHRLLLEELSSTFGDNGTAPPLPMPPRPVSSKSSFQASGLYNPGEVPFPDEKMIRHTIDQIIPVRYGEQVTLHRSPPPLATLVAIAQPAGTSLGSTHWVLQAGSSQTAILLGPTTTLTSLHPLALNMEGLLTPPKDPRDHRTVLATQIRADPAFPVQSAMDRLCTRVLDALRAGGTILLAQWPWGSHFTLLDALVTMTSNAQMGHIPLLVVGKRGDKARMYSDILGEWMGPGGRSKMYSPASPMIPAGIVESRRLRYIPSPGDPSFHLAYQEPSIIFAGDPYLLSGPSKSIVDIWRGRIKERQQACTNGGYGSGLQAQVPRQNPLHYLVILPEPEIPLGDILGRQPPVAPDTKEGSRLDVEAMPVDVRLTPSQLRHDFLERWGRRNGGDTWVLDPRVWSGHLPSSSLQFSTLYPPMLEVGRDPHQEGGMGEGKEGEEEVVEIKPKHQERRLESTVEISGWGSESLESSFSSSTVAAAATATTTASPSTSFSEGGGTSRLTLPAWVSPDLAKDLILQPGEKLGEEGVIRVRAELSWRQGRWELMPWLHGASGGEGMWGGEASSKPQTIPLSSSSPFQEGRGMSGVVRGLYDHLSSKGMGHMSCQEKEEGFMGRGWCVQGRIPLPISRGWPWNRDEVTVWVMERNDESDRGERVMVEVEVQTRMALKPMTQWIQEWLLRKDERKERGKEDREVTT